MRDVAQGGHKKARLGCTVQQRGVHYTGLNLALLHNLGLLLLNDFLALCNHMGQRGRLQGVG